MTIGTIRIFVDNCFSARSIMEEHDVLSYLVLSSCLKNNWVNNVGMFNLCRKMCGVWGGPV